MSDENQDKIAGLELSLEAANKTIQDLRLELQKAPATAGEIADLKSQILDLQNRLADRDRTIAELQSKAPVGDTKTIPNLPDGAVQLARSVKVQNVIVKAEVYAKDGDVLFVGKESEFKKLQERLGAAAEAHPVSADTVKELVGLGWTRK